MARTFQFPILSAAALACLFAIGASAVTGHVAAQTPEKSPDGRIWDGAFTTSQADRGQHNFSDGSCALCHRPDLEGGQRAPALKGEEFMKRWENASVYDLFLKIRDTMPPGGAIGGLTEDQKLDVVAFLLRSNEFPAGSVELKNAPAELDAVQIVRKGAAQRSAPNFTLVRVVGCLMPAPGNVWMLTKTSEPIVTRDDASTAAALTAAETQPLGTHTYTLFSVSPTYEADAHKGQKVEARGLLYRSPSDSILNLTSLQPVASECAD